MNGAFKTEFALLLCDPYLAAMTHNFLKTQDKEMWFTQFHAKCIFMFGSQSKKIKVSTAAHATDNVNSVKSGEEKKTHSQVHA